MERHWLGLRYGISTDSLAFTEVHESKKVDNGQRLTTLLSVEARVCSEPSRLCLRVQHWAFINGRQREAVLRALECVYVCHHLSMHDGELPGLVESSLDACSAKRKIAPSPKLHRCSSCNLDFQLSFKDVGHNGIALVVTKWLDLGSGLELEEPVIPGGSRGSDLLNILPDRHTGPGSLNQATTARLAFEEGGDWSEEALYLRNASLIVGEQYKRLMAEWTPGVWILQAGQRVQRYSRRRFPPPWVFPIVLGWICFVGVLQFLVRV